MSLTTRPIRTRTDIEVSVHQVLTRFSTLLRDAVDLRNRLNPRDRRLAGLFCKPLIAGSYAVSLLNVRGGLSTNLAYNDIDIYIGIHRRDRVDMRSLIRDTLFTISPRGVRTTTGSNYSEGSTSLAILDVYQLAMPGLEPRLNIIVVDVEGVRQASSTRIQSNNKLFTLHILESFDINVCKAGMIVGTGACQVHNELLEGFSQRLLTHQITGTVIPTTASLASAEERKLKYKDKYPTFTPEWELE